MVDANIDERSRTARIILTPNRSWSWRANLYILYTLTAVSMSIAVGFALMGAWMILPWSAFEMLVLLSCLWYCAAQCSRQEVITISEHEVLIERGIREPEERSVYHRIWSRFLVRKPRHPWDPAVVSIRSHGQEQEIGSFLNKEDKSRLIDHLQQVVAACNRP